ncbi:MAG: DUF488 domain-containing protein [Weeksellaceae bacterium]|nr:DUF488 domain-containing protein [Weeksellaceae bacterium]
MKTKKLFTIGHGIRPAQDFLQLLQDNGINCLVDVRTKPFSRWHPQYNQKALKNFLESNNITYIFLGDSLGGRPADASFYTTNGKVDYNKLSQATFFIDGITQLVDEIIPEYNAAIMCSESKPADCHRTHLVAKALDPDKIEVQHINEKGNLLTQNKVLKPARQKDAQLKLFTEDKNDK